MEDGNTYCKVMCVGLVAKKGTLITREDRTLYKKGKETKKTKLLAVVTWLIMPKKKKTKP